MARFHRFTFVCDDDERALLEQIATRLQRSQSDAMRWLVRNAASELALNRPASRPVGEVRDAQT